MKFFKYFLDNLLFYGKMLDSSKKEDLFKSIHFKSQNYKTEESKILKINTIYSDLYLNGYNV